MSRDAYGFRAEAAPATAGSAHPGSDGGAPVPFDDADARRALWLAGGAIGSIALAPCVCYLSLLGTIPLGVMSWRASTPLRTRTSPLVRDIGRFAHVTGIVTTVLGSISVLALIAYGLFIGAMMLGGGDALSDFYGGSDDEVDIVGPEQVPPMDEAVPAGEPMPDGEPPLDAPNAEPPAPVEQVGP